MHKTLEELYTEEVLNEGIFDRMGARAAGVGGALKGVGKSLAAGAVKQLGKLDPTGATTKAGEQMAAQGGIKAGYNAGKLKSITTNFQNEMKTLFGNDWATTYPDLATALQKTAATPPSAPVQQTPPPVPQQTSQTQTTPVPPQQQAPKANKQTPLQANAVVTGKGGQIPQGSKFKVTSQNGDKVVGNVLSKAGKPYSKPIEVSRQKDIVESKKVNFEETYQMFKDVPKL